MWTQKDENINKIRIEGKDENRNKKKIEGK